MNFTPAIGLASPPRRDQASQPSKDSPNPAGPAEAGSAAPVTELAAVATADISSVNVSPAPAGPRHAPVGTAARVMLIVMASLALAYFARSVIVPVLLACFISMALLLPVRWLRRIHVPALLAAGLVVSLSIVGIAYGAIHLGKPALVWLGDAPNKLPQIRKKFQHILRPAMNLSEAASSVGNLPANETRRAPQPVEVKDNRLVSTVFTWTGTVLFEAGETMALVFLLLAFGDSFLQKVILILPTLKEKKRAVEISRAIHQAVSQYLFCVGLVNACLGLAVAIALYLLGMPNPVMWGGVAGVLNFIPYFGPVAGVTAMGLGGLLAFDSLAQGLTPAGVYLLLHLIETNLVTPIVLGRRFTLNPVIIFVALMICIWLWGVVGALLAAPLPVTLKILCDHVPALGALGELISGGRMHGSARSG